MKWGHFITIGFPAERDKCWMIVGSMIVGIPPHIVKEVLQLYIYMYVCIYVCIYIYFDLLPTYLCRKQLSSQFFFPWIHAIYSMGKMNTSRWIIRIYYMIGLPWLTYTIFSESGWITIIPIDFHHHFQSSRGEVISIYQTIRLVSHYTVMDQLTVINGLIMIHTYVCIYIYTYNLSFRNYFLSLITVTWAISVLVILVL
jgi:hypothetical protein